MGVDAAVMDALFELRTHQRLKGGRYRVHRVVKATYVTFRCSFVEHRRGLADCCAGLSIMLVATLRTFWLLPDLPSRGWHGRMRSHWRADTFLALYAHPNNALDISTSPLIIVWDDFTDTFYSATLFLSVRPTAG